MTKSGIRSIAPQNADAVKVEAANGVVRFVAETGAEPTDAFCMLVRLTSLSLPPHRWLTHTLQFNMDQHGSPFAGPVLAVNGVADEFSLCTVEGNRVVVYNVTQTLEMPFHFTACESMNIDSGEMFRYIGRIWCDSSRDARRNIGNDRGGWTPVRATRHRAHARDHSSRPTLKGGLGSKKGEEGWVTTCARVQNCCGDARSVWQNDPARYARRASAQGIDKRCPARCTQRFLFVLHGLFWA
jgi:hypothetical protein